MLFRTNIMLRKIILVWTAAALAVLSANADIHDATRGAMQDSFDKMGRNVDKYKHMVADGVPFVALQAGASICQGEFARLRANFSGATGFTVFGGVGKELIFDRDYKDKMTWHAGVGYYVATDRTYCVNLDIMAVKAPSISDVGIMAEVEANYFLPRCPRLGFFLGLGVGLGELDSDNTKKLWEVSLGVSFKLFAR